LGVAPHTGRGKGQTSGIPPARACVFAAAPGSLGAHVVLIIITGNLYTVI